MADKYLKIGIPIMTNVYCSKCNIMTLHLFCVFSGFWGLYLFLLVTDSKLLHVALFHALQEMLCLGYNIKAWTKFCIKDLTIS